MRNYIVGLELDSGTKMTVNGTVLRDEDNLVIKPIDYPTIISISISECRDSARLLTDKHKIVNANINFLESWTWNSETHIYQSQEDIVSIRGDNYADHYMVSDCNYTQIVIDDIAVFVDMSTGGFTVKGEDLNKKFQAATVREDTYYTYYDENQHITVGYSSSPTSMKINEKKSNSF